MSKSPFLITCVPENAERFAMWLKDRGGISLWKSINLSNPGASWCTPALAEDGTDYPKPNWQTENAPALTVCDPDFVGVEIPQEFKRVKISLKQQGLMKVVLTDGSTRKVTKALEEAGDGSFYTFEDDTAIIWRVVGTVALMEWLEAVAEPLPRVDKTDLQLLGIIERLGVIRGFGFLRFKLAELGTETDNESIRLILRSMVERNLLNKTLPEGSPIPSWSLTLRGLEVLKRNATPVDEESEKS